MQYSKQEQYNQNLSNTHKNFLAYKTNKKKFLRRSRIRRSILDALVSGDFNYRLTKEDMEYIAQVKYDDFSLLSDDNDLKFFESISDLFNYDLSNFQANPNKDKKLTLFFKLNNHDLNESYWNILVVTGEVIAENKFIAYYANVKNNLLPHDFFYSNNIHIININFNFFGYKSIENYNSGLWALECANYIHTMLTDNNLGMDWLYEKITEINEDFLIKIREEFVNSIRENPIYIERNKNFVSYSHLSNLDTHNVIKQRSHSIESLKSDLSKKYNKKESVEFLAKHFIKEFTVSFLSIITIYSLKSKGKNMNVSEFVREILTAGMGAGVGAFIANSHTGTIPSIVASTRGLFEKYVRIPNNKARTIKRIFYEVIILRKLPRILAEASIGIFSSFESQFTQVVLERSIFKAIEKIAKDGAYRAINSIWKRVKNKEIIIYPNVDDYELKKIIQHGVLFGSSKKSRIIYRKGLKIVNGYIVKDINDPVRMIGTNFLYKKVGIVTQNSKSKITKFYSGNPPKRQNKYGYRKPFSWEIDKNGELHRDYQGLYVENNPPEQETKFKFNSVHYEYVLNKEDNLKIVEDILSESSESFNKYRQEVKKEVKNKKNILFDLKKPVPNFIGRKNKIEELHKYLSETDGYVSIIPDLSSLSLQDSSSTQRGSSTHDFSKNSHLAISGLGGIGKTQLALYYASQYAKDYHDNILWINAETKENLSVSFYKLATTKLKISIINELGVRKELDTIVREVYEYFSDKKSLFIFDNVENYQSIKNYLPHVIAGNNPKILITSRFSNWEGIAKVLTLSVFSENEAIEFISQELMIKNSNQYVKIEELATLLSYMPLALQQATAYIKMEQVSNPDFSINDYINIYKIKSSKLLDYSFSNVNNDPYLKTVLNTWLITLDHIRLQKHGQQAVDILYVMAYLDPENISKDNFIFLEYMGDMYDHYNISEIIFLLKNYSMINVEHIPGKFTIHRLVQEVLRINLEKEKNYFKYILGMTKKIMSHYHLENQVYAIHYMHFYLYIYEHLEDEDIKKEKDFKYTDRIEFFSRCNTLNKEYFFYFLDLAFIKFNKENFINFLSEIILYNTKKGFDTLVSEALEYIEKKYNLRLLSMENVKYFILYMNNMKKYKELSEELSKDLSLYRYSSSKNIKERQINAVEAIRNFPSKIFNKEKEKEKFIRCKANPLKKRSICSINDDDLEKIQYRYDENRKIHLRKVQKLSGFLSTGLMTINILSEIAQGHWEDIAINFELISGSIVSNKVADKILEKGIYLEKYSLLIEDNSGFSEKKLSSILFDTNMLFANKGFFLSKTMKVSSTFVRRGATIFFIYNLAKEIQAYQNGEASTLPDIVFNGLIVAIDSVETGIETIEFLDILTGVSEVAGPIGEVVAAFSWLGFDIYSAEKQLKELIHAVHMSFTEKLTQFLRGMVLLSPSEYLLTRANNEKSIEQAINFLKENTQFKWYVFPLFKSPSELYNNSQVLLNKINYYPKEDESLPFEPKDGHLFCLPISQLPTLDNKKSTISDCLDPGSFIYISPENCEYLKKNYQQASLLSDKRNKIYTCLNALGVEYSINRENNLTFIELGDGEDVAITHLWNSFTIFMVHNGHKIYLGNNVGSLFKLKGTSISGMLYGGDSDIDTIDLAMYYPEKSDYLLVDENNKKICGKINYDFRCHAYVCPSDSDLIFNNINQIYGRKNETDIIALADYSEINFVDGLGGKGTDNERDKIIIKKNTSTKQRFVLRNNSIFQVYLNNTNDGVDYIIPENEIGHVEISFFSSEPTDIPHQFFSQYPLEYIDSINVSENKTIISIRNISNSSLYSDVLDEEKLTISIVSENISIFPIKSLNNNTNRLQSISYFFNGIEFRILNSHQLYVKEISSSNQTITDKINYFNKISKKLDMAISIQSIDNKTICIGNGKNEIIYTNGLFESHLVGAGGEGLYVVEPEIEAMFPLSKIIIYDISLKNDSEKIDTLDLSSVISKFKQLNPNENFSWSVFELGYDLVISLHNSASYFQFCTILINDAFLNNWYKKIDIYLDNNVPKFIVNVDDVWTLMSTPLIFMPDKKLIVLTNQDIDKNTEIIFLTNINDIVFYYDQDNLILTQKDIIQKDDIISPLDCFTLIFKRFYNFSEIREKYLSTNLIFFDEEFYLRDYEKEIDQATSFSDYLSEKNITEQNIDLGLEKQNYQKINTHQVQEIIAKIQTIEEPVNNENNLNKNWRTLSIGLIASGAAICLGYLTWALKRRYRLPLQKNHAPDIRSSLALPLLNIPVAQAANMSENDIRKNNLENLDQLVNTSVFFVKDKKENNFLRKASSYINHLETLCMCDVFIRKFTGKKHKVVNEFFSLKSEKEEKILSCLFKLNRAYRSEYWDKSDERSDYSGYDYKYYR